VDLCGQFSRWSLVISRKPLSAYRLRLTAKKENIASSACQQSGFRSSVLGFSRKRFV
jgi:hypothetical protein